MPALASLLLVATMASATPATADIEMVCNGVREARPQSMSRQPVQSALQRRNAPRLSTIEVRINSERGRIHLADHMLPPVYAGGRDGWWRMQDIQQSGDLITGSIRMSDFETQKVSLNQRTGRVLIDGSSRYQGVCEAGRAMDRPRHPVF